MSKATEADKERLIAWTYNVQDRFKGQGVEEIKAQLQASAFPFAVLMCVTQDFNFASVIRSANAFGAERVYHYGARKYDRRGTTGTHIYTDVIHLPTLDDVAALCDQYTLVALENTNGSYPLDDFIWPGKPLLILGQEGDGIPSEILALASHQVEILQFGSVRSINAAAAGSVAMYDFVRKYRKNQSCQM